MFLFFCYHQFSFKRGTVDYASGVYLMNWTTSFQVGELYKTIPPLGRLLNCFTFISFHSGNIFSVFVLYLLVYIMYVLYYMYINLCLSK